MKIQRHYIALVILNLLRIGAVALFASGSITRARGLLVQTTPCGASPDSRWSLRARER